MPEQLTNRHQVGALVEQVCGEAVSQGVRRQSLRAGDTLQHPLDDTLNLPA